MRLLLEHCGGLPEVSLQRGETLFAEGGRSGTLYILIEGEVEVLRGDVELATVCEPGAVFGEMSVLLGGPHTATVRTLSPSRAYLVERAESFLRAETDIAYRIAMLLAQRLQAATSRLVELKRKHAENDDQMELIDDVLGSLVQQQDMVPLPSFERKPDREA